jgi:membrane fusion protein, copper/silver efflux system
MRNKFLWLLAIVPVLGVLSACSKKMSDTSSGTLSAHTLYHCAMHPQIISEKPGECPICHMRLTPIVTAASSNNGGIPGQAAVHLEPGTQQQIGVVLATATIKELTIPIRAAARVAYDPQLYNATLEHQEAAAFLRKARENQSPDLLEQAESTVRSSELRLRQMGLSDDQIADIERPGHDASGLLLGAGKGGKAWVYANVFDYEASLIHPGQTVELTSPALPGTTFYGTVKAIDPILNSDTRTLRVRIAVLNAQAALRPETYLSATIQASLGNRLTVPDSAVMDTGTRQLVYVEKAPGTYEPREVQAGHRAGDFYEILSGLKEGERVVASANFLIDSESRIQAATLKATQDVSQ